MQVSQMYMPELLLSFSLIFFFLERRPMWIGLWGLALVLKNTSAFICVCQNLKLFSQSPEHYSFPILEKFWKIEMKIELWFNQGSCIPTWRVLAGRSLWMEWGQSRNQAGPLGLLRWTLEGLVTALVLEREHTAPWRSSGSSGLKEEVNASSFKPCYKLPQQSCL